MAAGLFGASLVLPMYGINFDGPTHPTASQTGLESLVEDLTTGVGIIFGLPALAMWYVAFAVAIFAIRRRIRLIAALLALGGGLTIAFNGHYVTAVQIGYWVWVASYLALVLAAVLSAPAAQSAPSTERVPASWGRVR